MRLILLNIFRFTGLIFLQIFVVNQMNLGFLNPYISIVVYISFLITFPVNISKYILLLVALILGLTIDMFQNTGGIHASACVFLAFVRPFLLSRIQSDNPIDDIQELNVYTEDLQKYIMYCFILSFFFFIGLFLFEEFSFGRIPLIALKAILSSTVSTSLIILGQYLFIRKPKKQ
jgi:rod shape-determining protein MreD